MTSHQALKHLEIPLGTSFKHHLLSTPVMLCIEGIAAVIRGDLKEGNIIDFLPADPYLCTGFDVYLSTEPEMMSSMALIHSRVRRVFFKLKNPEAGALGSNYYLHQFRSLNHQYRVFQINQNETTKDSNSTSTETEM